MTSLKTATLTAFMYLGMSRIAGKSLSFAITLVLVRLLTPQDYGLMALVMVVVGLLQFFNEVGLGSAIRQRVDTTPEQLDGCFTLSLLISSLLYAALFAASPWISVYFDHPELSPVLRMMGVTLVIGAASTVSEALMAKSMQFKLLAAIDFLTMLLQSTATLTLAWLGHGVWALAWGFVVGQSFKGACTLVLGSWHPRKLGGFHAAADLMRFGLTVTYTRLTWFFYSNSQSLIIGKTLSTQAIGVFSMAESLAGLPTGQITSMVIAVASPLFSQLQHDHNRLNQALLRLTRGLALINYPIMIGMACTAQELVPVVLGPQWLEATLPLQVLCLMGLLKTIDPLLTQALTSSGQVHITARYTSLCAVTIPTSVYLGSLLGGLAGVAIGIAVAYPLSAIYLFWSVRRYLHMSLRSYLQATRLPLEACAWMAAWVLGIAWVLRTFGLQNDALLLSSKVITGIVAYSVFLIYVRRDGLRDCHEVLRELGVSAATLDRWPFSKVSGGHTS